MMNFIGGILQLLNDIEEEILEQNIISNENSFLLEMFDSLTKRKGHHFGSSLESEETNLIQLKNKIIYWLEPIENMMLFEKEKEKEKIIFCSKDSLECFIELINYQKNIIDNNFDNNISVEFVLYTEVLRKINHQLNTVDINITSEYRKLVNKFKNNDFEEFYNIQVSKKALETIENIYLETDKIINELKDLFLKQNKLNEMNLNLFYSEYKNFSLKKECLLKTNNKSCFNEYEIFVLYDFILNSEMKEKEIARECNVPYDMIIRIKKSYQQGTNIKISEKRIEDYQRLITFLIKVNEEKVNKIKKKLSISDKMLLEMENERI